MIGVQRIQRPEVLQGVTSSLETGSGRVHVTVNYYDNRPYEVFVMLGKAGSEERALTEGIGRLCSTALQNGTPLFELASQLRGISSEANYGFGPNRVLSVADAVGRVLGEHYTKGEEHEYRSHSGVAGVGPHGDQGTRRALPVDGSGLRPAQI